MATAAWLIAMSAATALDTIKTKTSGFLGKIVDTSPLKVELQLSNSRKEIPVNQIETIFYDNEPGLLKNAKLAILARRYDDGLNTLFRLKIEEISREEIREDMEFYTALATAQLAIARSDKVADAGRLMIAFTKDYPNSYHYFQACEILGDLLVANASYAAAEEYYAKVAKAPWPDYQMKVSVAIGRALLAQGKLDDALKTFEKVLANQSDDALSQTQRQAAKIGKAAVLVAMNQNDEAIKLIESIIHQADPDDALTQGRAYNILGNALRQKSKDKDALMAFLHVDLLYSSNAEAHAEALYNLAELWEKFHKMDRAVRARQILEQQYKNSPWAQRGGQ